MILCALLATAALAACETATPYQPVASGNAQAGGYSEARIETNRWRVTFQGNSLTSRQTVEDYLLYRAAELARSQGYDWFEAVDRATDRHVDTYATPEPVDYGWRPYWRYYGLGRGWIDPLWDDPFFSRWGPTDFQTVERYQASAEIVMGHGAKPAGNHRAFDASEVIANLSSRIVRPK